MLNLSEYSNEELQELALDIMRERANRNKKEFPYKEGDCFYCYSSNKGHGFSIIRIDNIEASGVKLTILTVDALDNSVKFDTTYSFQSFYNEIGTHPKMIDAKVFDLYSKHFEEMRVLKDKFVRDIYELMK